MKFMENYFWRFMKISKIYEIQWESSEDKKPALNRANVSIGAACRALRRKTYKNTHARNQTTEKHNLAHEIRTGNDSGSSNDR